jgi:uncharacterized protein (TIGR02145 family)
VSEDGGSTFKGPLKSVSGDVGSGVKPGSKTITWNTLQDQSMVVGDNIIFRIVYSKFGKFIDNRDGKTYKTVKIGTQTWMAENLAYKATDGCWAYDNNESNVAIYGFLYDWQTAKNVCPAGWHLPSNAEWIILETYLGGESVAGGKLKEAGISNWTSLNASATNETNFTALPGGCRNYNGPYYYIGKYGYWWSSTENSAGDVWSRSMSCSSNSVPRSSYHEKNGFSVRCIKD